MCGWRCFWEAWTRRVPERSDRGVGVPEELGSMNMTDSHIRHMVDIRRSRLPLLALAGLISLTVGAAAGQQRTAPGNGQNPPKSAESGSGRLTLRDAIALALKKNLGVRVAGTQVDEAAGTQVRRRAALEPHVTADAFANL